MRHFKYLVHRHRTRATDRALGLVLAFNAGAVNAGGFVAVHMYTSHMSGFASQVADGTALRNPVLVLNALGAILAFVAGAAVCAVLVNWGRRQRLQSVYALPLLLEGCLMFPLGLVGAVTLNWPTPFAVPTTVLLLSFMMGLQNAVASKTSGGSIRTTHMTGNLTDFGIELGKMLYWNRGARVGGGAGAGAEAETEAPADVRHDRSKMRLVGGLVAMFVLGGFAGALGFQRFGFLAVVPLAALLLALALPPLGRDLPRLKASWRLSRPALR